MATNHICYTDFSYINNNLHWTNIQPWHVPLVPWFMLPLCGTSWVQTETRDTGSQSIRSDRVSQGQEQQTGPMLPPPPHPSDPCQTAAWRQSAGTAVARPTPGRILQGAGKVCDIANIPYITLLTLMVGRCKCKSLLKAKSFSLNYKYDKALS